MRYVERLLRWAWRAWPVVMLAAIIAAHICVLYALAAPASQVNKITGTVFQVLGGLIVLHSIDGNLGLFRKQSLLSTIASWLREFPRIRPPHVVSAAVGMAGGSSSAFALSARVATTTVEQRLAELERRADEAEKQLRQLQRETEAKLSAVKSELSVSIAGVSASLQDLAAKVEVSALGGLKQQAFGVLLAVYGAFVSLYA
jgi:chromosome segregation ATPase